MPIACDFPRDLSPKSPTHQVQAGAHGADVKTVNVNVEAVVSPHATECVETRGRPISLFFVCFNLSQRAHPFPEMTFQCE